VACQANSKKIKSPQQASGKNKKLAHESRTNESRNGIQGIIFELLAFARRFDAAALAASYSR